MGTQGSLTRYAHALHSPDGSLREEAARQIWLRFSGRLAAEVHRRLNAQIRCRAGVEDVVQTLFASFFAAAPGPAGPPRNRSELWRVLVRFTICKVANTVDHHQAKRRDVRLERHLGDVAVAPDNAWPSPYEPEDTWCLDPADEAVAKIEFDRLLDLLPVDLRDVLFMRLQGYTNFQIAAKIGRVERTVEFKMRTIRELLGRHVEGPPLPSCG